MKLPPPVVVAFQSTLNQYISLDPGVLPRLKVLAGKLIQLHIHTVNTDLFLLFHSDRIEVMEEFAGAPDAVISGAPLSLLAVATGRKTIHEGSVTITGEVEVAQKFSRMLDQLDIDWDEHLSRITGDTAAHLIGRKLRQFAHWANHRKSVLQSNTADFLRDESNHLPYDWEIDEFADAVDELRDRVEQLEISINQMASGPEKP
ncbi:hypothetical protein AB833_16495 [Chromatiales bacterium (ex Bugula neritina AB1)]|nr:hypothetical protein AB833_16495 [Chromatiales bacterium (ex Bugula neritina AB1)]